MKPHRMILIGDIGANSKDDTDMKRAFHEAHRTLYPRPVYFEDQLEQVQQAGIPIFSFYVRSGAKSDYERYSSVTEGEAQYLDVNSSGEEGIFDRLCGNLLCDYAGDDVKLKSDMLKILSDIKGNFK